MEDDDDNVNGHFSSVLPLFPQSSDQDSVIDADPIRYCIPRQSSSNSTTTADFPPFMLMSPTIHHHDHANSSPIWSPFPQVPENPSEPTFFLFPENPSELTLSLLPKVSKNCCLSLFSQVSEILAASEPIGNNTPPTPSSASPLSTDLCLSLPYTCTITTLQCSIGSHHSSAKRSLFQEERFVPVKKIKMRKDSTTNNPKRQRLIIRPPAEAAAEGEEGQWITKILTQSDVNGSSRLLIPRQDVKKYVLPFMDEQQEAAIVCNGLCGVDVNVYDMDTETEHVLTFKKWATDSFILVKAWTTEFVKRRNLEEGDVIRIRWEKNNSRFCFRLHMRRNQVVAV